MSASGLLNLQQRDPFAHGDQGGEAEIQDSLIHVRIQQRNGRKTLTTVQGLSEQYDKKKLIKYFKKVFACNGTVVDHLEYGEVIQLQGDQRNNVKDVLVRFQLAKEAQIKIHGF